MNVLHRLGEILAKDGIKKSALFREEVLPSMFNKNVKPSPIIPKPKIVRQCVNNKTCIVVPKKVPKNLKVKENIGHVGKGSKFGKKVAKEYLSPLQGRPLSRHNIIDDYDAEKAKRLHGQVKYVEKNPKLHDALLTRFLRSTGDMLAALIACSPPKMKVNSQQTKKIYLKYSKHELPQIPNFENDPRYFENYIGLLSHTEFLHKNSSSTNGIVPKILRNLMHPANIKTLHLRTTRCYNDLIFYFSEKFDFATCRELFVQMKVENVTPNTVTYNLLLRSVLKNSHIRKNKFFDEEVLYYLKNMETSGIEADSVTWTTCYNLLGDDVSRLLFVEQMHERNVPFTEDFIYTVLRNGDYSSNECLVFLTNHQVPLNPKTFKLCVSRLLLEDRLDVAWAFLEYTWKNSQGNLKGGIDVVNQFMREFAAKGRLDLALMTFNTYVKRRAIEPDMHIFEMLFKALVKNGYHRNFAVTLTYIQNLRKKYGFGNRNNYWLVKALSIVKFNVDPQLGVVTPEKLERLTSSMNFLEWGVDTTSFTTRVWDSHSIHFKNACRMIGCIPMAYRRQSPQNATAPHRKAEYRKRIRYVALQNAMLKRVPYAKDWYGTLKKELEERGLSCK